MQMILRLALIAGALFLAACSPQIQEDSQLDIVGGENVASLSDPGAASMIGIEMNGSLGCGATLIGPRHLVSAAHCFDGARLTGMIYGNEKKRLNMRIKQTIVHENSGGQNGYNFRDDIAVVALDGSLPDDLKPAAIANINNVANGTELLIMGYGVTGERSGGVGILRKTTSSVARINTSSGHMEQIQGEGQGSCYGDSGGPAFNREGTELIGIVSHGSNCDRGDGVYTFAPQYVEWIKKSFEKAGTPIDLDQGSSGGESQDDSGGLSREEDDDKQDDNSKQNKDLTWEDLIGMLFGDQSNDY
jgi:secreted trypsin-like serine protease